MLKPIDIMALAVILVDEASERTQTQIADMLGVSQSNVHRALQQLERSGLVRNKEPIRAAAFEFLVHAVKYVYPVQLGAPARGVPTAHAVLPGIVASQPYVWPSESGQAFGPTLEPLHPAVLRAASDNPKLYRFFALLDVFRIGRVRERLIAEPELRQLMAVAQ